MKIRENCKKEELQEAWALMVARILTLRIGGGSNLHGRKGSDRLSKGKVTDSNEEERIDDQEDYIDTIRIEMKQILSSLV